MFEKLERTKVFRDPLYDYINVDYKVIDELIDTPQMQRLRRIRQLAGLSMVFHTAEHSRFSHSLGVYEMARRVTISADGFEEATTEYEKVLFLCAALLHDIGHGPYSHAFESEMDYSHEEMGMKIILSNTEVNQILLKHNINPSDICSVIGHDNKFPLIESLVSSQLDVDRMDYLMRDSYNTGALYGTIDTYRIIRSIKIVNNQVTYRASGAPAIESYLMSRYHMYFQVYFHRVARSYELMLQSIYRRIKDLVEDKVKIDADIEDFMQAIKTADIENYLFLDDNYINGLIKNLTRSTDEILNFLCNSFINRKLFKYCDYEDANIDLINKIKEKYDDNFLKRYYFYDTKVSQSAYTQYGDLSNINRILIYMPDKTIVSLEEYSPVIKGLIESSFKTINTIFYI